MKNALRLLIAVAVSALLGTAALAQFPAPQWYEGGVYQAAAFGQYRLPVYTPVAAAGAATITVTTTGTALPGGPSFQPIAANTTLIVQDGQNTETITPSSVSCSAGTCSVTATFADAHPGTFYVTSGTGGLAEAINWAASHGGGTVLTGPAWSGTSSTITGVTGGSATVAVLDTQGGNSTFYYWNGSAYALGRLVSGCSGVSGAMVAGTITISNSCILGTRPITLTEAVKGGTQGILSYTQSAGSLVITSSSGTDTSTVVWVQN